MPVSRFHPYVTPLPAPACISVRDCDTSTVWSCSDVVPAAPLPTGVASGAPSRSSAVSTMTTGFLPLFAAWCTRLAVSIKPSPSFRVTVAGATTTRDRRRRA